MKPKTTRVQVKLPPQDHAELKIRSIREHRTLSEELEETLVQFMAGDLDNEVVDEKTLKATALTLSAGVVEEFNAYCKKAGKPMNTMLRLAVAAKLRKVRSQSELFAAIDTYGHKHGDGVDITSPPSHRPLR